MTQRQNDQTIADVGEFALIDLVRGQLGTSDYVLVGPGDDAAHIATADGTYVTATDILIEGRHFRRDWSTATDIGRKAVAANLSDINAMGGVATALLVAFAAPGDTPVAWVTDLVAGMVEECAKVGARIVGGDMSAADQVVISITALGDAERPVTRSGAQPGDQVAFAGTLGLASAGYGALSRGFRSPKAAVDEHRAPHPPYAAGPAAAVAGATAMIDISDGLLADLGHVARASKVAIDVHPTSFEILDAVQTVAGALGGVDPLGFVLTGGDDYALAATFPADATLPEGWTRIGVVRSGEGVTVAGAPWEGGPGHRHWT
ncbi:thiamine-phosphate kinase [Aeromicrobium duanguangcaii]|uniref:Thiamine-monophosphate kinase n=1 Tax=Aeromicrobium duanguangcaii TaxID=2968086 RepID=A0ABY5KG99_9ACTN|nr:thiamine-phosphate kinase [Aeromicrobium duanguangcaii]MCD9153410.1 thiamine-phosphate kinase [Aeromicrobium duanguangcaii]MCL3836604.1 thiamine-phosphate kinase [Aeromicrobium duanguangcaii]UUI69499.1 thiamine-phosphate kinase [Aeromicrobium duanguangcaii]